ncbi:MAG TPA: serpin family protein [Candidatus Tumulicola sp.]|nr:serpin family protein [Candidatus Tumulicola sp.]
MRLAAIALLTAALATIGDSSAVKASIPPFGANDAAAADNAFGFALLRAVTKGKQANAVLSPVSVGLDLAMVYNGARGQTATEMDAVLQLKGTSPRALNSANSSLEKTLRAPVKSVELDVANSLWSDRRRLALDPAFTKALAAAYAAEIRDVDFSAPATLGAINAWADKETRGKIKKILDSISHQDLLFLINAVYFKGEWSAKFDKKLTVDRDFKSAGGSVKKVPLMQQSGEYRYAETKLFQAIQLPYGDGALRMFVFLPDKSSSLAELVETLDAANWSRFTSEFSPRRGHIELPRFSVEYSALLNRPLMELGMRRAFSPQSADLGAMFVAGKSRANPFIGFVKHDTYLRVDEEGSEAAAMTTTGIRTTSIRIEPPPFTMVVDRPFFCAIADGRTGALLFVGAIYNP